MGYIQITKNNIENEHICCALGAKQYEKAVNEKKKWLTERMDEGLVFYRLNERGKVFIEYLPAEMAWIPIYAPTCILIVFGFLEDIKIMVMRNSYLKNARKMQWIVGWME